VLHQIAAHDCAEDYYDSDDGKHRFLKTPRLRL
jgi:hypothetical protein